MMMRSVLVAAVLVAAATAANITFEHSILYNTTKGQPCAWFAFNSFNASYGTCDECFHA